MPAETDLNFIVPIFIFDSQVSASIKAGTTKNNKGDQNLLYFLYCNCT
ncbi:hypothetical protein XBKQ1_2630007 [Xenorhabdus bovienii str. kraussei Quebec]|uniref:Uncharacterized protein n=1 Tax=Xenorhabdus bovienii str. kraussei Quebec TaxID=1398203 RepID=A0A077PKW7_XENBV|nr:hypothetical protein XBKQ1_2630007 [Xenorhabdus bovienii str. kraussei Quebec]